MLLQFLMKKERQKEKILKARSWILFNNNWNMMVQNRLLLIQTFSLWYILTIVPVHIALTYIFTKFANVVIKVQFFDKCHSYEFLFVIFFCQRPTYIYSYLVILGTNEKQMVFVFIHFI